MGSSSVLVPAVDAHAAKARSVASGVKVLGICAFAAVLRLVALGRKSLTADESFSFWLGKLDWHDFVYQVTHFELNMAPYYAVMRAWGHHTPSEFVLRLPSVIFGVATVPIVYLLGRRLFSERAGLTASLLFAIHTGSIAYSQEARSYSLAVLLCASAALCLSRAVQFAPPAGLIPVGLDLS